MDQVTGVSFLRQQFHQAVFAVPGIQPEGQPDQQGTGDDSERNAYPLVDTRDEQDDEQEEYHDQAAGKDEQVLRLEPFQLNRISRTFINPVLHRLRGRRNGEWWRLQSGRYTRKTNSRPSCWYRGRRC